MTNTKTRKPRHRKTPHRHTRKKVVRRISEADGVYFAKLVVVTLLGTLWLKFASPMSWNGMPFAAFPLGALIAIIGIKIWEKDQFDRKIWFAVLLVVMMISYFVPAGIVI